MLQPGSLTADHKQTIVARSRLNKKKQTKNTQVQKKEAQIWNVVEKQS